MSAILIHWLNMETKEFHTALLLNGIKDQEKNENYYCYISVRDSENKKERFHSNSLEHDIEKYVVTNSCVIPTIEDGNAFGLSEIIMATYWSRMLIIQNKPEEELIRLLEAAERTQEDEKIAELFSTLTYSDEKYSPQEHKVISSLTKPQKLLSVSRDLTSLQSESMRLKYNELLYHILKKGGIDAFTLPQPDTVSHDDLLFVADAARKKIASKNSTKVRKSRKILNKLPTLDRMTTSAATKREKKRN